jgi:hypothetical protein
MKNLNSQNDYFVIAFGLVLVVPLLDREIKIQIFYRATNGIGMRSGRKVNYSDHSLKDYFVI